MNSINLPYETLSYDKKNKIHFLISSKNYIKQLTDLKLLQIDFGECSEMNGIKINKTNIINKSGKSYGKEFTYDIQEYEYEDYINFEEIDKIVFIIKNMCNIEIKKYNTIYNYSLFSSSYTSPKNDEKLFLNTFFDKDNSVIINNDFLWCAINIIKSEQYKLFLLYYGSEGYCSQVKIIIYDDYVINNLISNDLLDSNGYINFEIILLNKEHSEKIDISRVDKSNFLRLKNYLNSNL